MRSFFYKARQSKRVIVLLICAFFAFQVGFAQRGKKAEPASPTGSTPAEMPKPSESTSSSSSNIHDKVYRLALKYNDFGVATAAIYYQLIEDPNNMALKDSLASLYFTMNAFPQSVLLGKEILEKQPDNRKMLEMVAIAHQGMGLIKESLDYYEQLYKLSQSSYHLYQIAVLQYSLKRLGECNLSLDKILKAPDAEKEKIRISINQQQRQEVSLKAAALNVKGVLLREQKELEGAKTAFEEALKIEPEFALPKGNLEDMKNPKSDKDKEKIKDNK